MVATPQSQTVEMAEPNSLQTGDITSVASTTLVGESTVRVPRLFARDDAEGLAGFFERPRALPAIAWSTSLGMPTIMYPWTTYISSPVVANKLKNYLGWRGTLHVKIMCSVQPQVYGSMRFEYYPFSSLKNTPAVTAPISLFTPYPPNAKWLNPAVPTAIEFVCPFFYPNPWCTTVADKDPLFLNTDKLGTLVAVVASPLQKVDGLSPGTVDIQVYAWMENMELMGATYAYQSAPAEYRKGPLSTIASSVSNVASKLSDWPVIGPFARATEIGSTAIGAIAAIFGFSRPANINDPIINVLKTSSHLATVVGNDAVDKLTADPQQEVSIDPRTVGLSGEEMSSIRHMASQESVIKAFYVQTTHTTGQFLAQWYVAPMMCPWPSAVQLHPTHLAWAAAPFAYWTGTLVYRFRVVSSPFQRGRLFVFFDPGCGVMTTSPDYSTANADDMLQQTRYCILDFAVDTDVEFSVGWAQPYNWASNATSFIQNELAPTGGMGYQTNGMMSVFVDSPLSSPSAAASVYVIVTVRAGEDFQVAVPQMRKNEDFYYQGDLVATTPTGQGSVAAKSCSLYPSHLDASALALTHIGERIESMRAMSKRYVFLGSIQLPPAVTAASRAYRADSWGVASAPILNWGSEASSGSWSLNTQNGGYNITRNSYAAWWASTHAGYRGGFRYKIFHNIPRNVRAIFVITTNPTSNVRSTGARASSFVNSATEGLPVTTTEANRFVSQISGNGATVIDASQTSSFEFEVPHQHRELFFYSTPTQFGSTPAAMANDTERGRFYIHLVTGPDYTPVGLDIQVWQAAAEDFAPFYYVCPPRACIPQVPANSALITG